MASATIQTPVLADYSPAHFQALPALEHAKKHFLIEGNGEAVIKDTIKDFVVGAGMDRVFGVAMLYRHFDLEPDERLVDYCGTSTPWKAAVTGMAGPQPAIWAFDQDGSLKPVEFHYKKQPDKPLSGQALAFVTRFKILLDNLHLTNVLGLARYPGDDFRGSCEITHGRANINLRPEDYPADLQHIPTIWFFSTPLWQRGCRCTCNANAEGHPYKEHVYTT